MPSPQAMKDIQKFEKRWEALSPEERQILMQDAPARAKRELGVKLPVHDDLDTLIGDSNSDSNVALKKWSIRLDPAVIDELRKYVGSANISATIRQVLELLLRAKRIGSRITLVAQCKLIVSEVQKPYEHFPDAQRALARDICTDITQRLDSIGALDDTLDDLHRPGGAS